MRTLTALLTLSIAWCLVFSGCSVGFGGGDRRRDATVEKDGEDQEAGVLCGNHVADPGEDCDGADLRGQTCQSRGHYSGTLACTTQCTYDESGCVDQFCGNGECELAEGEDTGTCPEDCGWLMVSCGDSHTCALKNDGTAWCWGANNFGQLGDNTQVQRTSPVRVDTLQRFVSISAGGFHTCALADDRTVWCWGDNQYGQLGTGNTTPSRTPVQVTGLGDIISLDAGSYHTCAAHQDGNAWCWGGNTVAQLGNPTVTDEFSVNPVAVTNLSGVVQIAAGSTSCAVTASGTAYCWGPNEDGQVGNNSWGWTHVTSPAQVYQLTGASFIVPGRDHGCAVAGAGDPLAYCWGQNTGGQLGVGINNGPEQCDTVCSDNPVQVHNISGVRTMAAGSDHSCAVLSNGTAWCWGRNGSGQLGDSSTVEKYEPSRVVNLSGVAQISAWQQTTCAVTDNGVAWCWGSNDSGQLGIGTVTNTPTPTPQQVDDPYD